jgi:hypothetical protein
MDHDGRHLAALKVTMAAVRRRRSRLLRLLGQSALEVLTEGGSLEPHDPKIQPLIKDVQKTQRELHFLEDRMRSLYAPHPSRPPVPGTDPRFPFSR